ncbi:MAG: glycosyltransferase family 4 protein [Minisyncoccia bacterium]
MKIVILSDGFPPLALGGAEVIARNLAKALAERGHEVSVITSTKDINDAGKFTDGKINIYKIYSDYSDRWRAYRSLYNSGVVHKVESILSKIKPDIVHIHNIHKHLSYACINVAKKYSRGIVLTAHDLMLVHYGKLGAHVGKNNEVEVDKISFLSQIMQYKFRYNPFRNFVIRYYLRKVDKIFAVSSALKNILEREGISGIEVLHNGIKVSDWIIDKSKLIDFKNKYELSDKKVLFFGGRLTGIKGGIVALQVLEKVLSKIDNAVLIVVGHKDDWGKEMLEKTKDMRIDRKVIFTGWIPHEDIRYAYASSDVVLVLSRYLDPFPTINLEAMATSKAVVGTILGGTPEAVLDNKTGYIVDPNNIELVSEKVLDLLSDIDKLKSFGLSGFKRVSNINNEEIWVDKTILCYTSVL